jgi:hypothetical protein
MDFSYERWLSDRRTWTMAADAREDMSREQRQELAALNATMKQLRKTIDESRVALRDVANRKKALLSTETKDTPLASETEDTPLTSETKKPPKPSRKT